MAVYVFGIHIVHFFLHQHPKRYVYNDMCSTEQHYDARKNVPSARKKPRHKVGIKLKWVVNAMVCECVRCVYARKSTNRKYRITKEEWNKSPLAVCANCVVCMHTHFAWQMHAEIIWCSHIISQNTKKEANAIALLDVSSLKSSSENAVRCLYCWRGVVFYFLSLYRSSLWTSLMCAVKLKMRHTDSSSSN